MKTGFKIAMVYIGLIIGAGFASGREVLEYFNFRSSTNMSGVLLAAFLFIVIAYIILREASENKIYNFDDYITKVSGRVAPAVRLFMLLYMFCGLFVMYSGSGALVYSLSEFPFIYGALIMAVICFGVISFDIKGIVTLNLILVPLMICGIIFVAVSTAVFSSVPTFSPIKYVDGGVLLSAVCYSAYNTVTAGAVLVPLARDVDLKSIRIGAIGGGFCIGLLIMLVWTVQGANFDILYNEELPMLTLAALCGKLCKRVYTAVLFMAICTTAVSYGYGIMAKFGDRIKTAGQRALMAGVICISALPFSLYGFSNLVAGLYSFFGYIGMIWVLMVIVDRYK